MKKVLLYVLFTFLALNVKPQNFKTIKVANMVWMAENLNVQTTKGSWYYNDSPDNGRRYGRLYTWETAKDVCPSGWHLPTESEWNKLIEFAGGNDEAGKLLKLGGISGFNATLGGFANIGNFMLIDSYGAYWSASDYDKDHAWYVYFTAKDNLVTKTYFTKTYGLSVRCVKN